MDCILTDKKKLSENIYDFTVQCAEMAEKTKAGQFLHVLCGGDAYLRRPISVCEVCGDKIRFIFQIRGIGTEELAKKQTGDTLDILGPLGNGFDIKPDKNHPVLVGGGIGVFPLLELAKQIGKSATVVLGFRSRADVMLEEEFKGYAGNVRIATDDGSYGHHGFVTDLLKEELKNGADMVYTCGPTPMMQRVAGIANDAGAEGQVSLEERMACGIGACVTCACTVAGQRKRVCKDGPVFNASEVEWDG